MMMKENWDTLNVSRNNEGHPIPLEITLTPNAFRSKLLSRVPSTKAIKTYNSIETDNSYINDGFSNYENNTDHGFQNGYHFDNIRNDNKSFNTRTDAIFSTHYYQDNNKDFNYANNDNNHYPTLSSLTSIDNQSEDAQKRCYETSTTTLLSSSKKSLSCWSWCEHAETVLCMIALAAGMGNLYRLPQTTLIRGGLPFIIAYIALSLLIGFPLLFLELGLGQLSQEGFTKIWRAVPLFRGVGYIKLLAICLVVIYYPIYFAIFCLYLIWLSKGPLPFTECASVKITESGYKTQGIPGQECLLKTFLESPFVDPKWYALILSVLCFLWFLIFLVLLGRTKTYVKSLIVLLFPCVGCIIALIVQSTELRKNSDFQVLLNDADWSLLTNANLWYYAVIQVFFSTNVGFGLFVTKAGIIFSKVNAFWTSLGYIFLNIIFGIISMLLCFAFSETVNIVINKETIEELYLVSLIYDVGRSYSNFQSQVWTMIAFSTLLLSCFISMSSYVYILLKAIKIESKQKILWWKSSLVVCLLGFITSAVIAMVPDFTVIHILDQYVIGNLVLISIICEVLSIVAFYGTKRIRLDFEFLLGNSLSRFWILLWWLIPIFLLVLFIWNIATLNIPEIFAKDPTWLFILGWVVVVMAICFITTFACFQINKQDKYYTFCDKIVAITKPSRKWGPVDPIMRYSWVQWHTKAKNGERDFTLKRRGTRDYAHSVKKFKGAANNNYTSTVSISSTLSYQDCNIEEFSQNNNENKTKYGEPLKELSLGASIKHGNRYDKTMQNPSFENEFSNQIMHDSNLNNKNTESYNENQIPMSFDFHDTQIDTTAKEYGTFRKGPYKMPDDKGQHVCYRKYSDNEISTVL